MNESNMNIVLEALAETIQKLRVDIIILKGENERLKEDYERCCKSLREADAIIEQYENKEERNGKL